MSDGEVEARGRKVRQRRRERQAVARSYVVKFVLTEQDYADFRAAAERLGLAQGAYAAEASLAAARMANPPMPDPLREALIELMQACASRRCCADRLRSLRPCGAGTRGDAGASSSGSAEARSSAGRGLARPHQALLVGEDHGGHAVA
ncbi:hypothetical protein Pmi06nite_69710 [Planotetraspora mira]|uniref:Uncharacterized protein n=1 Tax=Planotetraspora mira TaxID=58121 RepID=A0A8J3XAU2_9ACTN|nr:hypothetical protein Pmi06nite_69710 [Planotetraspora mira]